MSTPLKSTGHSRPSDKRTKRKAALVWLVSLLVIAMGVFLWIVPPAHRIRVMIAFAIATPWAVLSLFYILRDD